MARETYQLNTEEACPEKAAGERSTSHFIAKDTPLNTIGRATSVHNIMHIWFLRRVPSKEDLAGDLRVPRTWLRVASAVDVMVKQVPAEASRCSPRSDGSQPATTPKQASKHTLPGGSVHTGVGGELLPFSTFLPHRTTAKQT